jgi:hypothetical protein
MTSAVFLKHYTNPARGLAAQGHWRWLHDLDSGVLLPHLYPSTATHLVLERLDGRTPEQHDLPKVAAVLGKLHGCAYAHELHKARLDRPFDTTTGLRLPAFPTNRHNAIKSLGRTWNGAPVALYKDANRRNFVVTAAGTAIVDFDDLTLAPFGYDLAKLIVSTAMTFGPLSEKEADAALSIYIDTARQFGGPADSCSLAQLAGYAEVHHQLTARYLGRNGYQHPWPKVRPWPASAPLA